MGSPAPEENPVVIELSGPDGAGAYRPAPPLPDEVVAGRRRRRARRVAVAAAALIAVIAAGYTHVSRPRPSHQPAAAPAATSPGTSGASPTSVAAPTPPAPPRRRTDVTEQIPAGFLVHELDRGERSDAVVDSECFGAPRASASFRHDLGGGAEARSIFQNLYVYPDVATARRTFTALAPVLKRCLGYPGAKLTGRDRPRWADQVEAVTVPVPADGANEHTGKPLRLVALRVGRAIATFEGHPRPHEVDAEARAVVARLCLYDPDCRPRNGLPGQLPVREGGEAWVAAVQIFHEADPRALPGAAIAAAAELGYHPSVVSVACDDGASTALGVSGADTRYVAVYFPTESAANQFARALPTLSVRIVAVRTGCG